MQHSSKNYLDIVEIVKHKKVFVFFFIRSFNY